MLSAAQSGDWEHVCRLESERRPLLTQYFSSIPQNSDLQAWQALGAFLLNADRQIMHLANIAKSDVANSLRELNVSQKATAAYQDNQP